MEAEQVLTGSDEGDFLQQYSTASKCLEDNFMCLLMLAHSFPCDAFEYPKQVRDLQLGMTPGSLKLEAVCSKNICHCIIIIRRDNFSFT